MSGHKRSSLVNTFLIVVLGACLVAGLALIAARAVHKQNLKAVAYERPIPYAR